MLISLPKLPQQPSGPLKFKGFIFLPKQEKTQFWTCLRSIEQIEAHKEVMWL